MRGDRLCFSKSFVLILAVIIPLGIALIIFSDYLASQLISTSSKAAPPAKPPTIYGGRDAQKGEYPFMAFLYNKKNSLIQYDASQKKYTYDLYNNDLKNERILCGATLIAPQWIITAAHCMYQAVFTAGKKEPVFTLNTKDDVGIGVNLVSVKGEIDNKDDYFFDIEEIQYPEYGESGLRKTVTNFAGISDLKDYALIKLKTAVKNVEPISLPDENTDYVSNTLLSTLGYGYLKNDTIPYTLQAVEVPISNIKEGIIETGKSRNIVDYLINKNWTDDIKSLCLGDSGGPFFIYRNGIPFLVSVSVSGPEFCGKYPDRSLEIKPLVNTIKQYITSDISY